VICRTISICQGKGSIGHNNRVFHTKNTNPELTPNNIVFVKQPIKEAYEQLFREAVERYNARQKRNDRKIKNGYFEYQFGQPVTETRLTSPDKRKSFYEDVVQLGTMEDTGVGTVDGERAVECLCEYMKGFSERNPNFHVFNAVLHLDEKTPHLHIDYIPVGHYKRGVDTQNGIAQALKEMGYGDGKNAIAKWRQAEYLVFRKICEKHGFQIAEPKKSRGSLTVEEYKNYCADKKRLNDKLKPLREMELAADESTVVGKKQLLSHNITVTPEEFEQLEKEKKAVAVQSIDNQRERDFIKQRNEEIAERSRELDKREVGISEKEEQLDTLISDAKQLKYDAEIIHEQAEHDFARAKSEREFQRDINEKYSKLTNEFYKAERENDRLNRQLYKIRDILNVPRSDSGDETIECCREIADENYQLKSCIAKELGLSYQQRKDLRVTDMLKTLVDNFKCRIKSAETEIEENRSIIASLRDTLSKLKDEFLKVVLGINALVYMEKYNSGLSGFGKALAKGISLFIDNCFKNRGEFDLIDKCEIDSEIRKNMELFTEKERTKNNSYYER